MQKKDENRIRKIEKWQKNHDDNAEMHTHFENTTFLIEQLRAAIGQFRKAAQAHQESHNALVYQGNLFSCFVEIHDLVLEYKQYEEAKRKEAMSREAEAQTDAIESG